MEIKLYQVDAFASRCFEGNPAAVCPLEHWLDDALMQAIAAENNLAETAFFVPVDAGFEIRWFTPACEVDLCGHATLASAWVLFNCLDYGAERVTFQSRSGPLQVSRQGDWLELDFPAVTPAPCETPPALKSAFSVEPRACLCGDDYLLVFDREQAVIGAQPDLEKLRSLGARGVIITAPSQRYDFVCRFFAPKLGIDEDPVTGSAFTQLIPYWAARLEKAKLSAKQVSSRGGEVGCELAGERVKIRGRAVLYLVGSIQI
ncbi:PhzF family phenazine biosynthesis protein [Marinobacterium sp. YM272]|uniref:PhzF family phenazine biosynthesis protein n=1 Tax=Marinobacterium sp. YM272 TaxID=3421654 RepID=UPI003D7F72DE